MDALKNFFSKENFEKYGAKLKTAFRSDAGLVIRTVINAALILIGVLSIVVTGGLSLVTGIPEFLIALGVIGFALEATKKGFELKYDKPPETGNEKSTLQKELEKQVPITKSPEFWRYLITAAQDAVLIISGLIIIAFTSGALLGFFAPAILIVGGIVGLGFTGTELAGKAVLGLEMFPRIPEPVDSPKESKGKNVRFEVDKPVAKNLNNKEQLLA